MRPLLQMLGVGAIALMIQIGTINNWSMANATHSGGDPVYPVCEGKAVEEKCSGSKCTERWFKVDTTVASKDKTHFRFSAYVCLDPINCTEDVEFTAKVGCTPAED